MGQRISLSEIYAGIMWFLPISVVGLILMIFFPGFIEAPF
jgi:TRAP-type mannitol/chloroaromatic compound transport system permease large subunit